MICTIRCKPKAIKQQYQAVKSFMQIDITVQADIIINSSNTVKAKTGALLKESTLSGSVVILGGLSLVNSLHAYTFASLKRKKLISTTPLNDALNALILALNASAAAFVLLFTKKFRILS